MIELGMNHAGEISTLVRDRRAGGARVDQRRRGAPRLLRARVDAIADAKAEILEGADAVDAARRQRRRRRVIARGSARFAGRVVTFGDRARRRRARDRRRGPRHRRHDARASTTPRGRVRARRRRCSAAATSPNVLAATAVALEFDVPLDDDRRARRALRPASHRGEVVRLRERRHGRSTTATTRARPRRRRALDVLGASAARRGASPCSARCSSSASARRRCTQDVRPRGGGSRRRRAARRRRRAGAARWPTPRSRRACRGDACRTSRRATRRQPRVAALVTAGDVVLVKGSRGMRTDRVVERLKAECG